MWYSFTFDGTDIIRNGGGNYKGKPVQIVGNAICFSLSDCDNHTIAFLIETPIAVKNYTINIIQ